MAKKGVGIETADVCISCLSEELKEAIFDKKPELEDELQKIPSCPLGVDFEISKLDEPHAKKTKQKRAPSPYNQYMSECVRSQPKDLPITERFKACALEWKKGKKRGES